MELSFYPSVYPAVFVGAGKQEKVGQTRDCLAGCPCSAMVVLCAKSSQVVVAGLFVWWLWLLLCCYVDQKSKTISSQTCTYTRHGKHTPGLYIYVYIYMYIYIYMNNCISVNENMYVLSGNKAPSPYLRESRV